MNHERTTLVIVPRWGGTGTSDFYPWLVERASEELGLDTRVAALAPHEDAPEPAATARAVREALAPLGRVIVLAHSVGCRAALLAASELSEGRIAHLLLVAGWFTVDRPWPSIVPWLREDLFDPDRVRASVARMSVLVSDDDPFTADHVATRAGFEGLGASVTTVPGARHFNAKEEPAVWTALARAARPT